MPQFHHMMGERLRSVEQGADTVVWLALSRAAARTRSGQFFQGEPHRVGQVLPLHIQSRSFPFPCHPLRRIQTSSSPASLVLTDCLCCRSQACCGPPASGLDPQLCRGGPEFHESAGDSGVQCRSAAAWWRAQRTVQTSVCLNCDVNDTQHVIHPLKQQLHEWKFLLFVMFNLFWYTVSFCSLIFKYFQQWLNVILLRFCTQVQFWGTCTLPESFHVLLPYTITGLYFRGKYNTLKFKCIHQQWKMLNIRPVSYLTHRKQYIVTCKYTCDLLLMFVHLITDVFNFYSSTIWLF